MIRTLLATCIGLVGMLAPASASGQWWPGFAPVGFDGPVNAMIDFEGATIVGGSFYAIGGDVMSASTVWDGNGFAELPAANSLGLVSDFIVHGGELFARSNGALERWTGSEWERIAWGLSFYPNGKADLASFGGELVIAGNDLPPLTCPQQSVHPQ